MQQQPNVGGSDQSATPLQVQNFHKIMKGKEKFWEKKKETQGFDLDNKLNPEFLLLTD